MKTSSDSVIENLLTTSSFADLSASDRAVVLTEMTAEEYDFYRRLVLESESAMAPSAALPTHALSDIKAKLGDQLITEKSIIEKISSAHLPLWLVALISLVGYGLVLQYNSDEQGNNRLPSAAPALAVPIVITDTVIVYKTDTLIVEVPAEPEIIIQEVVRTVDLVRAPQIISPIQPEQVQAIAGDQQAYHSTLETAELLAGRPGRSIDEEAELMELLDIE